MQVDLHSELDLEFIDSDSHLITLLHDGILITTENLPILDLRA